MGNVKKSYVEEAVLGSIILFPSRESSYLALIKLKPKMFAVRKNQVVFESLCKMNLAEHPIDLTSVDNETPEIEFSYLAELCKVAPTVNVDYYIEEIRNKYLEREALKSIGECQEVLLRRDLSTKEKLLEIQRINLEMELTEREDPSSGLSSMKEVFEVWSDELESRSENKRGMSTGIKGLDDILAPRGILQGTLFVVGGRPKMSKTGVLIKLATHCAFNENKLAAIFSLEMTSAQVIERMATQLSGISSDVFYTKQNSQFDYAFSCIGELVQNDKIYIDDTPAITLTHVISEVRKLKRERGDIGMIFIDYLTLMKCHSSDRNDLAYGEITKGLKALAKEMKCVVVLLTQLNRGLESRADKRPYPSDSRETGQIEQDCDYWLGLYRDSVYNEESPDNLSELILRLNRYGNSGTAYVELKYGQIFDVNQELAKSRLKSNKDNQKPYQRDYL